MAGCPYAPAQGENKEENVSVTAHECYDAMLKLGIVELAAHFSGGNDEGGYDDGVDFTMAGDAEVPASLATFYPYDEASHQRWDAGKREYVHDPVDPAKAERQAIANYLEGVLDGQYGGFGGDFSVYGNVIVDARARTTKIVGEESDYVGFEKVL